MTSRPRVRARRKPARRLTWARSSASTSGSGLRQHGGDFARERLPGPRRIAVADQHEIGEGPHLAPGGERIARARGRLQLGRRAGPGSRGRTTRRPGAPGPREPSRPRARSPRCSARPRCAAARRRRRAPRGNALAHRAQRCEAPPAAGAGHLHLPSSDAIVSRNPGATPAISGSYPMEHSWNPWVQPAPCRVRIRFRTGYDAGPHVRARSHRERQRSKRGRLGTWHHDHPRRRRRCRAAAVSEAGWAPGSRPRSRG